MTSSTTIACTRRVKRFERDGCGTNELIALMTGAASRALRDHSKLTRVHSLRQTQHRQPKHVEGHSRPARSGGQRPRLLDELRVQRDAIHECDNDVCEQPGFDPWCKIENSEQPLDGLVCACA